MEGIRQIAMQKSSTFDGGTIIGGALMAAFAENLPLIISIMTVILFAWRILVASQEYRINKKTLEKMKDTE